MVKTSWSAIVGVLTWISLEICGKLLQGIDPKRIAKVVQKSFRENGFRSWSGIVGVLTWMTWIPLEIYDRLKTWMMAKSSQIELRIYYRLPKTMDMGMDNMEHDFFIKVCE